jgi:preprotein translocase subunit SecA
LSEAIFDLASEMRGLSDQELKVKTTEFKKRLKRETLDHILPEAFAVVREGVKRVLGKRPFEEQVWAGIVLHRGNIVEMKSGEGKTIAETMPVYLNALEGKGVHVITSNDYLAQRDAQWVGPIFEFLGQSVGVITEEMPRDIRRQNYAKDIIYVANQEVGFDYLRDNLVQNVKDRVLRYLRFAIIDEVDSILIDEARTPLIISQLTEHPEKKIFSTFASLVAELKEGVDYEVDEKLQSVVLSKKGQEKLNKIAGKKLEYLYSTPEFAYHVSRALKAKALFHRSRDYLVENGKIILIDEFTGRLTPDRRLMEGLHQAIEAKEKVIIREKDQILGKITFQNFFRLYNKFSGMTGTAETSKQEFFEVYQKDVFAVPTHKPIARRDYPDIFFLTEKAKLEFIAQYAALRQKKGTAILVGARSVEKAIKMSQVLDKFEVPHQLLTAKSAQREAEQITKAGKPGMVTMATNMAGRGTDIVLDSSVLRAGGLLVIGTERHRAKRIDDQLRGRAGRQGEPGSSQFFVSMEDELVQVFGSDKFWQVIESMEPPEDLPFKNSFFKKEVDKAQQLAEALDFDSRKWLYQFDQVFDRQRAAIYRMRDKFLTEKNIKKRNKILKIIDKGWQSYLEELEEIEQGIGLVSYGGRDPLVEYALQTKQLFDMLMTKIKTGVASLA